MSCYGFLIFNGFQVIFGLDTEIGEMYILYNLMQREVFMKYFTRKDVKGTYKNNKQVKRVAHILLDDESDTYCNLFKYKDLVKSKFRIVLNTSRRICSNCRGNFKKVNPDQVLPDNRNRQSSLF